MYKILVVEDEPISVIKVDISAAAAASIFHFTQYTPKDIKDLLKQNNIPVRNV